MNPTNDFQENHITFSRPACSMLLSKAVLLLTLALAFAGNKTSAYAIPAETILNNITGSGQSKTEAYDRHFVVLVDQTVFFQGGREAMGSVYNGLKQWLSGKKELTCRGLDRSQTSLIPIDPFNEQHDQLSVFAFSLQGKGTGNGGKGPEYWNQQNTSFATINAMSRDENKWDSVVYKKIVESLIAPNGNYQTSQQTINNFYTDHMWPLFDGSSSTFSNISQVGAITLSYYVYPLIFDCLKDSKPAKQIILVVVSDFESGSFNENASKDLERLKELLGFKSDRVNYVLQRVEKMKQPYTQVEMAHIVSQKLQGKTIVAKATALVVKQSVLHSPLFIASNLNLKQRGTSSEFTMCPSTVSFNRSVSIVVDSIEIVVTPQGKPDSVMSRFTVDRNSYEDDTEHHEFRFDKLDLSLPTTSPGGLLVTYNFYTHSTAEGESLLPVLYTAEHAIAQQDIFLTNAKLQRIVTMVIITVVVIVLLIILLLLGRKKTVRLNIGNFTQKYTNITPEHGAEELPCWFYDGNNNTSSIRIGGSILLAHHFGLPINSSVSIRLQNLTDGFTCYMNGSQLTDKWVKVEKRGRKDFSLVLNIAVDTNKVNPSDLTTVSADIEVCVDSSIFGLRHNKDVDSSHRLKFFFTRDLGTAWVGFDPGTTGSCVSYGSTNGTLNNPAIRLVTGSNGKTIIPSCLVLDKNFGNKAIADLQPGTDYMYGSIADANAVAYKKGNVPVFRSIKKLLGYQNGISVTLGRTTRTFKGVDLAHLLVKGLEYDLHADIDNLSNNDRQYYVGNGGCAQRAVVAIPNNYTLPKILDMVDSVRRLPDFHEVRFVYEAEAVLFNYLSKNFKDQKPGEETVMVYDMGGATINLTVFRVRYIKRDDTIYYHIETLGRIGYSVGGDNIDVALMEHLLTENATGNQTTRRDFEIQNKEQILSSILKLKIDIIEDYNAGKVQDGNPLYNNITFANFMNNDMMLSGSALKFNASVNDNMLHWILISKELYNFVYKNIEDAVEEILKYPDVSKLDHIDTIIFSGRSTLFPQVKDHVYGALASHFKLVKKPLEFELKGEKVKTAVAYGACWYGIYNSLFTLDNSRLASAYGFKFTTNGKANLEVLLQQNCRFDKDGCISATSRQLNNAFNADGNQVNFYQIMGSGQGDDLFSKDNRHKVNYIGTIPATTNVENVSMSVTQNNIVTCEILFDTGQQKTIKDIEVQGRDITDENDWAYVFATSAGNAANAIPQRGDNTPQPASAPGTNSASKPPSSTIKQPQPPVPKNINRL